MASTEKFPWQHYSSEKRREEKKRSEERRREEKTRQDKTLGEQDTVTKSPALPFNQTVCRIKREELQGDGRGRIFPSVVKKNFFFKRSNYMAF